MLRLSWKPVPGELPGGFFLSWDFSNIYDMRFGRTCPFPLIALRESGFHQPRYSTVMSSTSVMNCLRLAPGCWNYTLC